MPRIIRTSAHAADANEVAASELAAGIEAYRAGRNDEAVAQLTRAQSSAPGNSTIALYLGLAYLKQDRIADAIAAWRRYGTLEPATKTEKDADLPGEVRRYLTLLVRVENERRAKQAIADEKTLGAGDPATVAVTYFENLGSKELGRLQKGIAAVLIADLAKVQGLEVLEREKLQALLGELRLSESGLVAGPTAPRVGKLLGAGRVVTGSYGEPTTGELEVDSVVADTSTASVVGSQTARGRLESFWEVQSTLAVELLASLGYDAQRLGSQGVLDRVQAPATKSLPAFVAYSEGLDAKDREDYRAAGAYFETALRADPGFALARAELLALPTAAATVPEIIASVSNAAPTAAVASAALAGTAAGISTTTTLLVAGGLVVAGGIAAGVAVGTSGGGGGGGSQCRELTQTCNGNCCQGLECQGGTCCSADGASCSGDSTCCSSACIAGRCGVCADRGDACTSGAECCSGLSCSGAICKDCASGASCSSDSDCCEGSRCAAGSCAMDPCPPGDNFCDDPGEQGSCPVGQVCAPNCQSCTCPASAPCETPGAPDGCSGGLVCAADCSGCVCAPGSECQTPGAPAGCGLNEVCSDLCACVCACDATTPCAAGQTCNPDTCTCESSACDAWTLSGTCECSVEQGARTCRITNATIDNAACDVPLEIPAGGIQAACQLPPSQPVVAPIPVRVPARQSFSLPPNFEIDIGSCEMGRVDAKASTMVSVSVEVFCGTAECIGTGFPCLGDECCGNQVCENGICRIPASTP